jgi:hypothetical protein
MEADEVPNSYDGRLADDIFQLAAVRLHLVRVGHASRAPCAIRVDNDAVNPINLRSINSGKYFGGFLPLCHWIKKVRIRPRDVRF